MRNTHTHTVLRILIRIGLARRFSPLDYPVRTFQARGTPYTYSNRSIFIRRADKNYSLIQVVCNCENRGVHTCV